MASKSKSSTSGPSRAGSMGGRLREAATTGRVVLLIVAVLALVFVFENTRHVKIRIIGPEVSTPLWLALAAMLVIGWLLGRFVTVRRR
ncbi:DUF1049 domain-containing protein [Streptomyces huiliensis]|uniref:DUF1049 domain-containing protein n=1 Tax=Streptomyces huiliensis TaxID=2876027 RepID=UPI001CBB264A|nr:DUF1049 domain-containing protein [Streptomyces huiliensis]MBZ4321017.1 DUF1049 domain-containing protein [Streptomyces huiliensis]